MAEDAAARPGFHSTCPTGLPRPITAALERLDPIIEFPSSPVADPVDAWAASGAMWLSGHAHRAPVVAPGVPAQIVAVALECLRSNYGDTRSGRLPGTSLLGERAAMLGLRRQGSRSCNGASHLLEAPDGYVAVSLARASDLEFLPALLSGTVGRDPLAELAAWVGRTTATDVVERAQLLGIPAAVVPHANAAPDDQSSTRGGYAGAAPITLTPGGERPGKLTAPPLIVDLSSLWAGPLCAHLLGHVGGAVVKVESPARPDGARFGSPGFYNLLHGGHQSVTVDMGSASGRAQLTSLLERADLVIEASRPRAMSQLGIDPLTLVEQGTVWLSITAYGRSGPWSNRVGFGDDVAAGAGMVGWAGGVPCFLGDALADPVTGVVAALAAAAALRSGRGHLLDISMRDVMASTVGPLPKCEVNRDGGGRWWVTCASGTYDVAQPRARNARAPAPAVGADNDRWLGRS